MSLILSLILAWLLLVVGKAGFCHRQGELLATVGETTLDVGMVAAVYVVISAVVGLKLFS